MTAELGPRGAGRRILLVDNDAGVCQVVQAILGNEGYDVLQVPTAEAGLAALETQDPDAPFALVVLDLRMPGLGGMGFLERVNGEEAIGSAMPPVLVLSGFVSAEDQQRLAAHPLVQAVVEKPFDLFELAQLVHRLAGPAGPGDAASEMDAWPRANDSDRESSRHSGRGPGSDSIRGPEDD